MITGCPSTVAVLGWLPLVLAITVVLPDLEGCLLIGKVIVISVFVIVTFMVLVLS